MTRNTNSEVPQIQKYLHIFLLNIIIMSGNELKVSATTLCRFPYKLS